MLSWTTQDHWEQQRAHRTKDQWRVERGRRGQRVMSTRGLRRHHLESQGSVHRGTQHREICCSGAREVKGSLFTKFLKNLFGKVSCCCVHDSAIERRWFNGHVALWKKRFSENNFYNCELRKSRDNFFALAVSCSLGKTTVENRFIQPFLITHCRTPLLNYI